MLLTLLAFLGGVLTIVSPCILPVLPFVFARADQPFARNGLPMLLGMAITFVAVASLVVVGGAWAVRANQVGRYAALAILTFLALTLLSRTVADWLTRPFVALGSRLTQRTDGRSSSAWSAAGLGVATGLLWAPCAGPILGLLLTTAALNGASASTALLLLAYALGAAASLALALLAGGRVFAFMRRSLGVGEWVRRGLGALVLLGVAAIAMGLDTGVLARVSLASTGQFEQRLVDALHSEAKPASSAPVAAGKPLPIEGQMPELTGATAWLNSAPLTRQGLKGKVVLIDFWTYSCINCIRTLPYVRAWAERYAPYGLVVIGVHTPEFAFEKDPDNVRKAIADYGIRYPVAMDNDYRIWRAFDNHYWPAHYFIDGQGRIRQHYFGEGDHARNEAVIRTLLREAGQRVLFSDTVDPGARGAQLAASSISTHLSPETYLGAERSEGFAGGALRLGGSDDFQLPATLAPDRWALGGNWQVQAQFSRARQPGARIAYRFRARDLHLVLGPAMPGQTVRFRVTIDGKPPGADRGMDVDDRGEGRIDAHRLYQLVRQRDGSRVRTFEIEFLDAGAQAYAFTFG